MCAPVGLIEALNAAEGYILGDRGVSGGGVLRAIREQQALYLAYYESAQKSQHTEDDEAGSVRMVLPREDAEAINEGGDEKLVQRVLDRITGAL
jgi:hypothetical protein